ncbi:MAG: hypothetical protein C0412_08025 [Flavobacterium sp.]|nr:hypothetical protein [Flavobacterium sp.]
MKKIFIAFLIALASASYAQKGTTPDNQKIPKIYVSGNYYDLQHLKKQIPVVDYVNDRKDADVHVLVTSQSTGSGGSSYILLFYGQNHFDKLNDTIRVITNQIDSEDIIRNKLIRGIKTGLFQYLRRSGVQEKLIIDFEKNEEDKPEKKEDPWDSWVFRASINGYSNGEASSKYTYFSGTFSASRTTEDLRLSLSVSNSYNENSYNYDIDGINYDFLNITRTQNLGASVVKSLSDNWSLGAWGTASKSTYGNIDFSWALSGGIEYNLFPYTESSQKQLRLAYKVGPKYNKYFEETIFFKESENLFTQTASASLSLTQPWGSVSFSVSGSNYLHDMSKYSLSFDAYFSVKLIRGLSLNFSGYYSKIRDQISLARSGASVEDVLLRIRQLETQYSYFVSVGVSFSFGSIFNSIVNPRFGGGGGTVIYMD